jgi:hypothetical protein
LASDEAMELPGNARWPARWRTGLVIVLLAVAGAIFLTEPPDYIDSFNYAQHIVKHGGIPAAGDPFWDFGHVMWRPLGALVWRTLGTAASLFYQDPLLQAALSLVWISVVSAFTCTVFLYLLILRSTRQVWVACLTTIAFMASCAVLDYALTGMAYTAGIALQIASLYVLFSSIQKERFTASRALLSGILAGASVCLWFPYGFTLVGFLLFGFLWNAEGKRPEIRVRAGFMCVWIAAIALALALCYVPAMHFRGIHTLADFQAWIAASRYGISPTRGGLRAAIAIPRSFVWMGDAGILFKRFLFDAADRWSLLPSLVDGIWKIAAVYGVLALLTFYWLRRAAGRIVVACLLATAAPTMIFAVFLFDPSPPIRYIALYPLLFFGLSFAISTDRKSVLGRIVFPGFCLMIAAVNLTGMSRFHSEPAFARAAIRLDELNRRVAPGDRVLILVLRDDINRLANHKPFDPISRNRASLWAVIPLGADVEIWKSQIAAEILRTWSEGGRVWLSKRMLAPAPRPDWNWVEGDDTRIAWADIPAYFRPFEVSSGFGGEDGFLEFVRSPENETRLRETKDSK